MIDLEDLAEQTREGVGAILDDILARGVSLYGNDRQGRLIEIAPDGRKYLVHVEGDRPVRIRELRHAG